MSSWRPHGGSAARPLARRLAFRPQLLPLEDRAVPSTTTSTDPSADPTSTTGTTATTSTPPPVPSPSTTPAPVTTPTPSTTPTTTTTTPSDKQMYAVGADIGNQPLVQVYNPDGSLKYSFLAYDARFRGGVRVAVGDVTGDGVPDIITAPGPGMPPEIEVFDGTSGAEIANFMAYNVIWGGGVYVAVADVNGDGHADIITGAGAGGGPHVKVFDGAWAVPPVDGSTPTPPASQLPGAGDAPGLLGEWYAYGESFRGGVRVAAADINGDGHADIIEGAGPGGGPHVKAINGVTGDTMYQFYAFGSTYTGGVYVTAGDMVGNHKAEVAVGSGVGLAQVNIYNTSGSLVRTYGVDSPLTAGVHVGTADVEGNGSQDLILTAGTNVEVRNPMTNATVDTFTPFDPTVLGGVFVG